MSLGVILYQYLLFKRLLISGKSEILQNATLQKYLDNLKEKQLIICNAKFERIEENTFENISDLECLRLENNLLDSIEINAFANLKCLKKLVLSFNQLSFIENKLFESLSNLEELEITNNQIKLIYPQVNIFSTFAGQKN